MARTARLIALAVALAATAVAAQSDRPGRDPLGNPSYDGRFTLVRLRWKSDLGGSFRRGGFSAAWNHDYPRAERNLAQIVGEITTLDIRLDDSLILTLDDPDLLKYPVALMWEPGFWNLTESEAEAFRAYLLKGGFAIFEDFDGAPQWSVFAAQMARVLPEGQFVKLGNAHPIFNVFFRIHDINAIVHPMSGLRPNYFGIYEDNDPSKRLMVIANFDNDVPEYWEWSGSGLFPFDMSNEAYKLGVNYLIYGMTH